ncbi:hypothetical protein ACWD26_20825 [Streptomyces sp. NPDC002787]
MFTLIWMLPTKDAPPAIAATAAAAVVAPAHARIDAAMIAMRPVSAVIQFRAADAVIRRLRVSVDGTVKNRSFRIAAPSPTALGYACLTFLLADVALQSWHEILLIE